MDKWVILFCFQENAVDENLEQEEEEEALETGSLPKSPVPGGIKETKKGEE